MTTWKAPNRDVTDSRTRYFVESGLWPVPPTFDPRGWLSNFADDDLDFAYALLQAFIFIPQRWTDQIFRDGMQALARIVCCPTDAWVDQQKSWRRFLRSAVITYITGEQPNPTDSGFEFARKARDLCGISEDNICAPDDAFSIAKNTGRPVIFVDDFVGSGSQAVKTWTRLYGDEYPRSFADLARADASIKFVYAPLVATTLGLKTIRDHCGGLLLRPSHILNRSYGAFEDVSFVWPSGMRDDGVNFLARIASELGMPDTGGAVPDDWKGFAKLGLCFGFNHSIPDASLAIFRWKESGWKPLMRRP